MNEQVLNMIRELSDAKGVSGYEDEVLPVIRKYAAGVAEVEEDHMRNLYLRPAWNKGGRPVVQLDGHSDEVGFMVQAVKPNGLLRFVTLGGWVRSNIPAHRVWVLNDQGKWLPGIIASKPPHFMTDAEKNSLPQLEEMAIDLGVTCREDLEKLGGVSIGAPVVPDVRFELWQDTGLMQGKAFDNRLGCAAVIETLRRLAGEDLAVDVVGSISVQEEVGCRGATVTAQRIHPDAGIVFEGCPADDTCTEPYMTQTALGRGPMLRWLDKKMITSPRLQKLALSIAREKGIPAQTSVRNGGSTNASALHLTARAVPCIVMGVPVRYAHTHYCLSSLNDFEASVQLAVETVKALSAEVIGQL